MPQLQYESSETMSEQHQIASQRKPATLNLAFQSPPTAPGFVYQQARVRTAGMVETPLSRQDSSEQLHTAERTAGFRMA